MQQKKAMRLLVLAGGFGTRLSSVVSDVPKALAPIGSTPFLQLQLENWIHQGIHQFTFLLHHCSGQIIDFLKHQNLAIFKQCEFNWVVEPTPLGTGGAIAHAVNLMQLKGNFLVANADTWLGGGVREMISSGSSSMAVIHASDISRYGHVEIDSKSLVQTLNEKNNEKIKSGWVNAGFYCFNSALFENLDGGKFSLEYDFLPNLVVKNQLKAIKLNTKFIDIGIPVDYYRFIQCAASRKTIEL